MTMADAEVLSHHYGLYAKPINNNSELVSDQNQRATKKRKRLSQVVDKLANENNNVVRIKAEPTTNATVIATMTTTAEPTVKPCIRTGSRAAWHDQNLNHHIKDDDENGIEDKEDEVFTATTVTTGSPDLSFFPLRLDDRCQQPVLSFEHYLHSKYLPDLFGRRSHSDGDLPSWDQDSPLDLSMKSSGGSSRNTSGSSWDGSVQLWAGVVPVVKGDVASPTTKESVAVRYNLDVSPVVEEMPPGNDVAYVCPVCGQMFSLHDRLAKHMASRHKTKATPPGSTGTGAGGGNENPGGNQTGSTKAYHCDVCSRSFARSDMLTRHTRLHTGVKPYTCRVCGQVFSRSDHLSTHQRTHTGEKPYKCPQCPYAACRRDMITRHMRTHARYDGSSPPSPTSSTELSGSLP